MNKQIEALKLALDALEQWDGTVTDTDWKIDYSKEIAAIREALAERFCDNNCTWLDHHPECDKAEQPAPQQEPRAWYDEEYDCAYTAAELDGGNVDGLLPLYTSPQSSKPLTDAQIGAVAAEIWGSVLIAPQSYQKFARAIEAKLKEKNNG